MVRAWLQGYSFKVVTNLVSPDVGATLQLATRSERLDLLATLRSHAEAAEGVEAGANDDGLPSKPVVRRKTGTLAAMSGADGLVYSEFSTAAAKPKGLTVRKLVTQRRAA